MVIIFLFILPNIQAVYPRVLVIIYDPIYESQGGNTLRQWQEWNDPNTLTQDLINNIQDVSNVNELPAFST